MTENQMPEDIETQEIISVDTDVNELSDEVNTQNKAVSEDAQSEIIKENSVPTVKKGQVTHRYYNGVVYSATFYDALGNPLKNTKVSCGINSPTWGVNATTDSNGVAEFPLALSKGSYTIYLINYDTSEYIADTINVFDVLTGGKNINMYYDGGNTYKVRVFGDDGKPVKAGQKVTFKINGKKYTKKTDKNGYAKLKITETQGYYYISATYKDFSVVNGVYVKPVLKAKTFSARKASPKVKFTVKFLGKNKKNKLIKVKFNKKTYKAKTNKKGVVTFKLKTPKAGKYPVTFIYKKSKVNYVYSVF